MHMYMYVCAHAYMYMYACMYVHMYLLLPLIRFATHSSGRIWKNGVTEQKLTHSHH